MPVGAVARRFPAGALVRSVLPENSRHPGQDQTERLRDPSCRRSSDQTSGCLRDTVTGRRNSRTRLRVSCHPSRTSEHSSVVALRGLSGAKDEVLLTATAQNLRRLVKFLCRPAAIGRTHLCGLAGRQQRVAPSDALSSERSHLTKTPKVRFSRKSQSSFATLSA